MSVRYATEAFVFKVEDSLEANRIFSVFARDFGRLELVGRSIRKIDSKLRGGIRLFSISQVEFVQGRHRKTLTDAVYAQKFNHIFTQRPMLEIAHKISELAHKFIKGQEPDEKIWSLLVDSFGKLNTCQVGSRYCHLVYPYFFWNFVSVLGYAPELSQCASCSVKLNPYELYFSNKEGGIICKNCSLEKQDGVRIKSDTVKILRLILKKDWDVLSKLKLEDHLKESLTEVSEHYHKYLSSMHDFE